MRVRINEEETAGTSAICLIDLMDPLAICAPNSTLRRSSSKRLKESNGTQIFPQ